MIPLCVPNISGRETEYVMSCLQDGWVSSAGPFVNRFESEFAAYVGAPYAVATQNGTSALHIALLVAGVQPGDWVVIPTLTFIAPVNAISYCGARPLFVDADPETWQMDVHQAVERMDTAQGRIGAIVPVHILGLPVDMDPLLAYAAERGIPVIEDATESLGGRYKGRHAGNQGLAGCFSFNGNKLITTGGGGMIVTHDAKFAERARYLSNTAKDEPVEFIHHEVGYNYRMTNVQAAMGVGQLEQVDAFLKRKAEVFDFYNRELADVKGFSPMPTADYADHAKWLYTARFVPDSRPLLNHLDKHGIQTRPLWQPIHLSPAYTGHGQTGFPVAERLNRECLSLPCSTHITDAELEQVRDAILAF